MEKMKDQHNYNIHLGELELSGSSENNPGNLSPGELVDIIKVVVPRSPLPFKEMDKAGLAGLGTIEFDRSYTRDSTAMPGTNSFSRNYRYVINPHLIDQAGLCLLNSRQEIEKDASFLLFNWKMYLHSTEAIIWPRNKEIRPEDISSVPGIITLPYYVEMGLHRESSSQIWQVSDSELLYPLYEQDYQKILEVMKRYER